MENKLLKLFEFQRFENNPSLRKIVNTVTEKYEYAGCYVDDNSLAFISGGSKSEEEFKNEDKEKTDGNP